MRKLFLLISFLVSLVASSQTQPPIQTIGNSGNKVKINGYGSAYKGFALDSNWVDTSAMNSDAFLKNIRGIQARSGDTIWQRSQDLTRWFKTGSGSINLDSSSTFIPYGDGSLGNPLGGTVNISTAQGNAIQSTGEGLFVNNFIQDGIKQPGAITWIQNYDYDVSPAIGVIGGIEYTSDWTPITLANSDPTLDRIDVVVFNAGGTITVITGTPAADPQQPTVDPATQLAMAFILVTANTTEPPTPPTQDWIYINNAEWTTLSSTARINAANTIFPYSVPLSIRGLLAQNNDNIRFTSVSPPTISNFNVVTLKIRSGSVWANDSKIGAQWYSGATPLGSEVPIANGTYGFTSTNLLSYQILTIPLADFGTLSSVTNLLLTVRTTGGRTITFYIDDIQLQQGVIPVAGNFWAQGGNSWGTTGLFGTNDNNSIAFKSNNAERMRLMNSGPLLIGGTTPNSASNKLELYGNTFIGGTLPKIRVDQLLEFDGSNSGGKFLFTSIGDNQGFEVRKTSNNGHMAAFRNTATDVSYLFLGAKTTSTLSSHNAFPSTQGVVGYFYGYSIINTPTTWGNGGNNGKNIWMDFYPTITGTSTSNIKIEAISDGDLSVSGTNNKEIGYVTLSARFLSPQGNHKVVIGASTNDGSNALQVTGELAFKSYGTGAITGTPAYGLAVTATGEVIEAPVGGGISAITADNGLTANTSTNVRLGGTLLSNTTITAPALNLTIDGTSGFGVLYAKSTTGTAFVAEATVSGDAIMAMTVDDVGYAISTFKNTPSTNTVVGVIVAQRTTTGPAADGIGGSIDFFNEISNGSSNISNGLISKWTTANAATRTSQFIITGVNSAVTADLFTLSGNGAAKLNAFGDGNFTAGTATYAAAWDVDGNFMEIPIGGGSGDVTKVGTPVNDQLGVWTGNGTIEGDVALTYTGGALTVGLAGTTLGQLILGGNTAQTVTIRTLATAGNYTLTLPSTDGNAGEVLSTDGSGNLSFIAAGSVGTVTSVSFTGGLISVATPTTTPAFTVAGTSGGIPYFSSASTWASSAALAANAIVIGGGAGVAPSTTTTGTGVLTALGVNVGSAGAFVTFDGALGTPSSGTLTNATGLPLTTGVTGTLPDDNGGTGQSTYTTGDILYASASNTLSKLAAGTNGFVLTIAAGVPTWAAAGSGTVISIATSQPAAGLTITGGPITTSGTFTFALANDLAAVEGLATTGIVRRTGTDTWSAGTAVSLTTEVTGTLPVGNGGTGLTSVTTSTILIGTGSNTWAQATPTATNGATVTMGSGSMVISTVFNPTVQTLTDGATITWNVTNGGNAVVTLAGTGRTLSITNPVAGYTYTVRVIQGSGGSKTITTWPTNTKWPGGVAITLSTTAGDYDVITFFYDGTNYYATYQNDFS